MEVRLLNSMAKRVELVLTHTRALLRIHMRHRDRRRTGEDTCLAGMGRQVAMEVWHSRPLRAIAGLQHLDTTL